MLRHGTHPRHMSPLHIHQAVHHLPLGGELDHQPPAAHGWLECLGQPPQHQAEEAAGEVFHDGEGWGEDGYPETTILCSCEAIGEAWEIVYKHLCCVLLCGCFCGG